MVEQVDQRRSTDQRHGGFEGIRRLAVLAVARRHAAVAHETLEPRGVDVDAGGEGIAGRLSQNRVATEYAPKLRDLRLQRVRGLGWLVVTPQLVDEPIVRDRARRREREQRQERLQLGPGHRYGSRRGVSFDLTEERHGHGRRHGALTGPCSRRTPPAASGPKGASPSASTTSARRQRAAPSSLHADDRCHPARRRS